MDGSKKSHFLLLLLLLASSMLILFAAIAATAIVVWVPVLPEAIAVNVSRDKTPLSEYVLLHESWRDMAALHYPAESNYCTE